MPLNKPHRLPLLLLVLLIKIVKLQMLLRMLPKVRKPLPKKLLMQNLLPRVKPLH